MFILQIFSPKAVLFVRSSPSVKQQSNFFGVQKYYWSVKNSVLFNLAIHLGQKLNVRTENTNLKNLENITVLVDFLKVFRFLFSVWE